MSKIEKLKSQLEIVELEERLEMVQLVAETVADGSNSCCTGVNSSCNPTTPPPTPPTTPKPIV